MVTIYGVWYTFIRWIPVWRDFEPNQRLPVVPWQRNFTLKVHGSVPIEFRYGSERDFTIGVS